MYLPIFLPLPDYKIIKIILFLLYPFLPPWPHDPAEGFELALNKYILSFIWKDNGSDSPSGKPRCISHGMGTS